MKKLKMSTNESLNLIGGYFNYMMWAVILLSYAPLSFGHMRGPHHPRSPVASAHSSSHNHYHPSRPAPGGPGEPTPILTHDSNLLHDKEHLKEDMGEWILADGKDLSPEEMEFHYFKMHDFDNNSMLDGLEILQAISHVLPMSEDPQVDLTQPQPQISNSQPQQKPLKALTREEQIKQKEDDFNYYIDLIDKVLEEDDMNKDGYLSYFEYVVGRRREESKEKILHSSNPAGNHK